MQLDKHALVQLSTFINERFIYRTGPDLVELFNEFGGFNEVYYGRDKNDPFPSRKDYTFEKLNELNGTKRMENLINYLLNSRNYIDTNYSIEEIKEAAINIIKYCDYSLELNAKNEYVIVALNDEASLLESPTVEVSFEEIRPTILEYIKKAEFHIWLSLAWFTDPVLFEALKEKANAGVNVQLLLNDDETNYSSGLPFESHFETYRKSKFGTFNNNIIHSKFCVIDLKYVMSGSYNWTKNAQFNKEDYSFTTNREVAEKYAKRFIDLKLS